MTSFCFFLLLSFSEVGSELAATVPDSAPFPFDGGLGTSFDKTAPIGTSILAAFSSASSTCRSFNCSTRDSSSGYLPFDDGEAGGGGGWLIGQLDPTSTGPGRSFCISARVASIL